MIETNGNWEEKLRKHKKYIFIFPRFNFETHTQKKLEYIFFFETVFV